MKRLAPIALAAALIAAPAAAQAPKVGDIAPDAQPLILVATAKGSAVFAGPVTGGKVRRVTKWIFYSEPRELDEKTMFNTISTLTEIDCTAGTLRGLNATAYTGAISGTDRSTHVLFYQDSGEELTTPPSNSIGGSLIKFACDGAPDPDLHPTMESVLQARIFTSLSN